MYSIALLKNLKAHPLLLNYIQRYDERTAHKKGLTNPAKALEVKAQERLITDMFNSGSNSGATVNG